MKKIGFFISLLFLSYPVAYAQSNYEIEVYESPLVPGRVSMVELHSIFLPDHSALHETVEFTHGFTGWLEVALYQFTSLDKENSFAYVGNHIRPRVTLPESYHCPVGLSLSAEFGYQVPAYCGNQWTLEIRPIIDKTFGRFYLDINPVLDYAFQGADHDLGLIFSPNAKVYYFFSERIHGGFEYYNTSGPFSGFLPSAEQPHQLALAFDIDFGPGWEFNIGYVKGLTSNAESDIFKIILGKKFGGKSAK